MDSDCVYFSDWDCTNLLLILPILFIFFDRINWIFADWDCASLFVIPTVKTDGLIIPEGVSVVFVREPKFLELWEKLHNSNFKHYQMAVIREELADNGRFLSIQKWIDMTDAIGVAAKRGRYGGTYAHEDIAFEFASWLSAEFKLYLITEFKRLKKEEAKRNNLAWNYQRFLTKVNYRLHTDTIRDIILPALQTPKNKEWFVYADEADLLNMAVFGQTAS